MLNGKLGNCLMYNNDDMAVNLTIVFVVFKILAVAFFALALFFSHRSHIPEEPADLQENDATNNWNWNKEQKYLQISFDFICLFTFKTEIWAYVRTRRGRWRKPVARLCCDSVMNFFCDCGFLPYFCEIEFFLWCDCQEVIFLMTVFCTVLRACEVE